jgi:hypothetical protein
LEDDNVVVGGGVVMSLNLADVSRDQLLYVKVVKGIPIQASGETLRAPGY